MQQWQVGPVPDLTYFSSSNTHQNEMHAPSHSYQQDMARRNERMDFPPYGQPQPGQPHHPPPVQPPMNVPQPPTGPPQPQPQQATPTPPAGGRRNKRPQPPTSASPVTSAPQIPPTSVTAPPQPAPPGGPAQPAVDNAAAPAPTPPPVKKSRTNTPWTPAEELRLKQMRDAGKSWAEIAKTFPTRTEGSVKKHWYKDMHYAEFAEDESQALLNAIKEYENSKWKVIGQKVGKPAKACEQYAKEHFPELFNQPKQR
ncbi:hypothetical protein SAPIO_CDS2051 [Scedosporium apiospermum]|uniref:MYB DNA-binding domain-containing protein n=2 Tax=Microascaceae TaxID=5593 RepID=A0A084GD50_PSEDA|nr:uncharacterized protein SAPIO_CDS2051 [Scedosporium apiospermum]KEZ45262.1 hypothetical protein SAPIO_CDS2051 [Scedosporium apiospermum]